MYVCTYRSMYMITTVHRYGLNNAESTHALPKRRTTPNICFFWTDIRQQSESKIGDDISPRISHILVGREYWMQCLNWRKDCDRRACHTVSAGTRKKETFPQVISLHQWFPSADQLCASKRSGRSLCHDCFSSKLRDSASRVTPFSIQQVIYYSAHPVQLQDIPSWI